MLIKHGASVLTICNALKYSASVLTICNADKIMCQSADCMSHSAQLCAKIFNIFIC